MPLKRPAAGMNSGSEKVYVEEASALDNFYTGAFNSDAMHFDPLLVGHAFIIWTRFPKWVTDEYPNIKQLIQKNFRSFDGLQDVELTTAGVQEGFTQNEYHVAQNINAKPNQFTLKALEYSGSPMRNAYTHWVTGIRDPQTGIATYPKAYGYDYRAFNHTAEMMYIITRPDADNTEKDIIEFAAYWTAVMPKKIPWGHLNWAQGQHTVPVEIDMPFSGILHVSPAVDEAAIELYRAGAHGFAFEEEAAYSPDNANTTAA